MFPGISCAIGRDVYAYKPESPLSERFIEHSIRYNTWQILQHARGDIPGLSKAHILDHSIALPPLNEQQLIASKIEELSSDLDAGVAALERAKVNVKRYRTSVLKAAVEGKLTEQWRKENPQNEPASVLLEGMLTERRKKWEKEQLANTRKLEVLHPGLTGYPIGRDSTSHVASPTSRPPPSCINVCSKA